MNYSDFKNQVDNLMNILFGSGVANHSTIIEQINYLVFLRSLSKRDDESINLDDDDRVIFKGKMSSYKWENLLMLNAEALFGTLEEIYKRLPELARDATVKMLYRDAHVKVYDKPTLRRLVHEIEKMMSDLEKEAASGHKDIFGDMYEYLLGKLSQAGTLGSFRTPRHIIKFIVDVIDPSKGETVLDPACGTAGFLVRALEHLKHKYTSKEYAKQGKFPMDKLDPRERKFIFQHALTGFDSDFDMFKFGLMNLFLHQLEHPQIKRQNTLVDTAGDRTKYDVILANPPFAGALDKDSISEDIRMGTRATEILFLRFMIDHLSPNGRAGVIVPEGVIFSGSNAHKKIRQMLIEEAGLWCVVSLPAGVFNPYAGVKTSVVFFDKTMLKKTRDILFVKIQNDGFDLSAQRRPVEGDDLPRALEIIEDYQGKVRKSEKTKLKKEDGDIAFIVSKEKIAENGEFVLSVERYKENDNGKNQKWPMVELGEVCEINPKKSELSSLPSDLEVSFVPMADVLENEMLFVPKQTKKLMDVSAGHTYFRDNDVLLAKVTPCFENGKAGIAKNLKNGIGFGSSELIVLRVLDRILPELIYYYVTREEFREIGKQQMTGTGGLQRLPARFISKYRIPLPSLEVQKQIVEELDGYQKIIDGARQVIEYYKPTIKIDPKWEMVELGEVFFKVTDTIQPHQMKGINNYVGLEKIEQNRGQLIGDVRSDISQIKSAKTKFRKGDILYGKLRPNLNKVWLSDRSGICSTDIIVLRCKDKKCVPQIYSYLLRSKEFNDEVMRGIKGAQLPRIGFDYLSRIKLPKPSISVQEKLVKQLKEEWKIVYHNEEFSKIFEQKIKDKLAEVWGG